MQIPWIAKRQQRSGSILGPRLQATKAALSASMQAVQLMAVQAQMSGASGYPTIPSALNQRVQISRKDFPLLKQQSLVILSVPILLKTGEPAQATVYWV